jgi:hypothetical protein
MSMSYKQVIKNIKELSTNEKALIAHCLISSLDEKHDEGVDDAWAELAVERFEELKPGYWRERI